MTTPLPMQDLITIGKMTLTFQRENDEFFHPIVTAYYEDGDFIPVLVTDNIRDPEVLFPVLAELGAKGPLNSLVLTTDSYKATIDKDDFPYDSPSEGFMHGDPRVSEALCISIYTDKGLTEMTWCSYVFENGLVTWTEDETHQGEKGSSRWDDVFTTVIKLSRSL
jgi:hypothetical protein